MKLQIDTKAKTIKIDEQVKFEDLIKVLNKLLPKEWKSYSLETGTVIYWPGQTIIYDWRNPYPSTPIYKCPEILCSSGVYNVECSIN